MRNLVRPLPAAALLAVLAACAPSAPTPAPGSSAAAATAPEAVIELQPFLAGALLTVPVALGDTMLPFLFDTGGGGTLVTPRAAGKLGCEPFGRVTVFRHGGEPVHVERCPPSAVEIGGWNAPTLEIGVFDLMALLPQGVPELGGIVAMNTFDGKAVTLDLGARRVIVESPASLRERVAGMAEVPYREGRQSGGLMLDPFLAVRAPEGPLWFELDSGNGAAVLIAPHAARQLGLRLSREEPRSVVLHLEGYGPVEVAALEKEMIYDGLLDAELMRRLRITLDLAEKRAWLAPGGA